MHILRITRVGGGEETNATPCEYYYYARRPNEEIKTRWGYVRMKSWSSIIIFEDGE